LPQAEKSLGLVSGKIASISSALFSGEASTTKGRTSTVSLGNSSLRERTAVHDSNPDPCLGLKKGCGRELTAGNGDVLWETIGLLLELFVFLNVLQLLFLEGDLRQGISATESESKGQSYGRLAAATERLDPVKLGAQRNSV